MKNDGDYLWDKTGEPDPEVQQLEEILGTLRYQPRHLDIPAGLPLGRGRSFFRGFAPRLAIAATIAMLLIGLGVWLALQRSERSQPSEIVKTPPAPAANPSLKEVPSPNPELNPRIAVAPDHEQKRGGVSRRHQVNQSLLAANATRARNEARHAAELREAEAAKDQLMLALRVASAKLNLAQRKTQSPNPREPVQNQHKIG